MDLTGWQRWASVCREAAWSIETFGAVAAIVLRRARKAKRRRFGPSWYRK